MFGLGFQEVLLLFVLALLLFGSKRLPEVGKALGNSIREFKKALQGGDEKGDKPENADTKAGS